MSPEIRPSVHELEFFDNVQFRFYDEETRPNTEDEAAIRYVKMFKRKLNLLDGFIDTAYQPAYVNKTCGCTHGREM
ncbi:MAG TPA: hypothetical protein VGF13_01840 [Verrucomicrobiae bacterium]